MKYFIDTEFIEDGSTIDLISIGIVCEDGREYYAQSSEFNASKASNWVQENVFPHLNYCPYMAVDDDSIAVQLFNHDEGHCFPSQYHPSCPWRKRVWLADEVREFMKPLKYGTPELWGYYSAYDHVALCQLFGTMMNLPQGFPMYTNDLMQLKHALGLDGVIIPTINNAHNALADARWNKQTWEFLHSHPKEKNA